MNEEATCDLKTDCELTSDMEGVTVCMRLCVCLRRAFVFSSRAFYVRWVLVHGRSIWTIELNARGRRVFGPHGVLLNLGRVSFKCRYVNTEAQGCSVTVTTE